MGKRGQKIEILERSTVERIARIIGPQSGAAAALADADRRIAEGQTVTFASDKASSVLIVFGEWPAEEPMPTSERATRERMAAAERDGVRSSWAEGE